jgi:hypothetical protein
MSEQQPEFVTFHGGPMDGYRAPVTGWTTEQRAEGAAHICDRGAYGPGGRSMYGPPDDDPIADVWEWQGDVP